MNGQELGSMAQAMRMPLVPQAGRFGQTCLLRAGDGEARQGICESSDRGRECAAPEFITFDLPFPPSVNVYYRRGHHATYLSKAGKAFKMAVAEHVAARGAKKITGRLYVAIALSSPTRRAYDVDNRIKACLDALQDAGVFDDDEQIDELLVVRQSPRGDYARVLIAAAGGYALCHA